MAKGTVAVDLDGVLHAYDGWKGPDVFNDPVPGAKEFLEELGRRDYEVVVHTTRPSAPTRLWLEKYGMLHLVKDVTDQKIRAVAYVDDRAVRFWGNWEEVFTFIETPPWWKQKKNERSQ